MSDKTEKRSKAFKIIKRIALFLLLAAIVCALVTLFVFRDDLNADGIRRWFKYINVRNDGDYGVYTFDSHSSNAYASFGDGLVVASVGGMDCFDAYGNENGVSQMQMTVPVVQASTDYTMAYDAGGSSLSVINENGSEVLRIEDEKSILDADLADDGSLCYSAFSSGYKSVLSVYNNRQKLVYRWMSSSIYMPVCAVSDGAEYLVTVGLGQENGAYCSTLYVFRTDTETVYQTAPLGDQLFYDVYFVDENTICLVGEYHSEFYSLNGELLGTYSYQDCYLKDFTGGGEGFLTLSVNMYKAGNRFSVVTVNPDGAELASVYIGQEILSLSACGKYVAVLTTSGLTIYDRDLQVYAQTDERGTYTDVIMREDGSALLLGGGQGKLYIP